MNLNQAVDQVRREQWRDASEKDRSVIKGSRFLLLAHAENLSDTGEQRLQELLRANEGLSMAYQLKEQFKGIFQYQKQGWAGPCELWTNGAPWHRRVIYHHFNVWLRD